MLANAYDNKSQQATGVSTIIAAGDTPGDYYNADSANIGGLAQDLDSIAFPVNVDSSASIYHSLYSPYQQYAHSSLWWPHSTTLRCPAETDPRMHQSNQKLPIDSTLFHQAQRGGFLYDPSSIYERDYALGVSSQLGGHMTSSDPSLAFSQCLPLSQSSLLPFAYSAHHSSHHAQHQQQQPPVPAGHHHSMFDRDSNALAITREEKLLMSHATDLTQSNAMRSKSSYKSSGNKEEASLSLCNKLPDESHAAAMDTAAVNGLGNQPNVATTSRRKYATTGISSQRMKSTVDSGGRGLQHKSSAASAAAAAATAAAAAVSNGGGNFGHIKKPLNAFMIFMREVRPKVVAEYSLKESAAINQILGRRWHDLTREQQSKYYEIARKEKELHAKMYPGWSARDNYACQSKRKRRRDGSLNKKDGKNHKCRARFGLSNKSAWCKACSEQESSSMAASRCRPMKSISSANDADSMAIMKISNDLITARNLNSAMSSCYGAGSASVDMTGGGHNPYFMSAAYGGGGHHGPGALYPTYNPFVMTSSLMSSAQASTNVAMTTALYSHHNNEEANRAAASAAAAAAAAAATALANAHSHNEFPTRLDEHVLFTELG